MHWKIVIRDTLIVWLLTILGGLVMAFTLDIAGATNSPEVQALIIPLGDFVFSIVAFVIIGALAKVNRFRHLLIVATVVWVTSLVNVLLSFSSFNQWLLALPFILVTMLIGGGLSFLFVRPRVAATSSTNV